MTRFRRAPARLLVGAATLLLVPSTASAAPEGQGAWPASQRVLLQEASEREVARRATSDLLASMRPKALVAPLAQDAGQEVRVGLTHGGHVRALRAPEGTHFVALTDSAGLSAEDVVRSFLTTHRLALGTDGDEADYSLLAVRSVASGQVVRVQQRVHGVPVFAGEVVVQVNPAGGIELVVSDVSRRLAALGQTEVTPVVTAELARQIALAEHATNPLARASDPDLVLFDPEVLGAVGPIRLAWQTLVASDDGAADDLILVDAKTGQVVFTVSQASGARTRQVFDCHAGDLVACTGPVVEEGGALSGDPEADAAYQYLGDAYDFYFNNFGRDSYDGAGAVLLAGVHFCPTGEACPWPDARFFADLRAFGFGEGTAVADDIVGHEYAHAVTAFSSSLIGWGESGAIAESLSDIFGELIDLGNGLGDDSAEVRWLIGEDVRSPWGDGPIRDMADPEASALGAQPDRRFSPLWHTGEEDSRGVHTNSGVGNKLAFLLADGGVFNGQTVEGMGLDRVAALFHEVQVNLLPAGADYIDLYWVLPQAALNLGWSLAERANLEAACQAVEIAIAALTEQQTVTVFADDFEGDFPGEWTVYPFPPFGGFTEWGASTFRAAAGTGSVWCAAAGTLPQPDGGPYVPTMESWLLWGPFSLEDAIDGWLEFDMWLDTEYGQDYLGWGASNQFLQPPEKILEVSGSTAVASADGWVHEVLNFKDAPSMLGESQVWVGFRFKSNDSVELEGAYIDNVVIRMVTAGSCAYLLDPASVAVEAGGGGGTVQVSAGANCPWTATSQVPWISVTAGDTGSGNGSFQYSVEASEGEARSGTVDVNGESVTIDQAAAVCTYDLSAESAAFTSQGGAGSVDVITNLGSCAWTANSNDAWITVTAGASGSGTDTVSFDVAANLETTPRSGTLTVAGLSFTVNQEAMACSYEIDPVAASLTELGGNGEVTVTAPVGCEWTAVSNAPWITLSGGGSGNGNGVVSYVVDANSSPEPRAGTVTIAGQEHAVTQDGITCTYVIAPPSAGFTGAGGTGTVEVTAPASCPWTAESNEAWLSIVDGSSGLGSGEVTYAVDVNPGIWLRNGTATIAGETFTVSQSGACPVPVGTAPGSDARGVALQDSYAYVAGGAGILRVIDVTDPANPVEVGSEDTPGSSNDVTVDGVYAYVADGGGGLRVIDVTAPADPVEVGAYDTPGSAQGVDLMDSYVYVADGGAGLRVVDVADPENPTEVGFLDTPWYAFDVAVEGTYAYVADSTSGLRVIDVSDPENPSEVGSFNTPGSARGVAVSAGVAYVADFNTGLRIINVTNPAAPAEIGFFQTPGMAYGVAVEGITAYVAQGDQGLIIINVAEPDQPFQFGGADTSGTALRVALWQNHAWTADSLGGLAIFDLAGCALTGLALEADVEPRGEGGDGRLTAADALQVGRFVAQLDQISGETEFQKTDCAPAATLGDAEIRIADWAQAGRYAAGLDTPTVIGGPVAPPGGMGSPGPDSLGRVAALRQGTRTLRASEATIARGQSGLVYVRLTAEGDENALGFTLTFDAAELSLTDASLGGAAAGATLLVNDTQKAQGIVGLAIALPPGTTLSAGDAEVLKLRFQALAGGGEATVPILFSDAVVAAEIVDAAAGVLPAVFQAGSVVITAWGEGASCDGAITYYLAAAAHTAGVNNTLWLTDVDFAAKDDSDAVVDILLHRANTSNLQPEARNVTIPAGRVARVGDILGSMFVTSNAALGVRVCEGEVRVNSRFYNTASECGGTYGMYIAGVAELEALQPGETGVFHHVSYTPGGASGFRTNVGFASASPFNVQVRVRLFGDDGTQIGETVKTLKPYDHFQYTRIHDLLETQAVAAGRVTVEVLTAEGRVHAYVMLIDNVSGDPIYMPVEVW